MIQYIIGSIILALLISTTSHAQNVKLYNTPPSASEMGSILFPKNARPKNQPGLENNAPPGGVSYRSISIGKPKADFSPAPAANPSSSNAIGLPIEFAYNSTEILPKSQPFLQEIGKMLNMPDYANEKLVIEGHTDASGSADYNQYLSERRAEAVKNYLVSRYNIAANRLFSNGMGESQLLPGIAPNAPKNRRVQFYRAP